MEHARIVGLLASAALLAVASTSFAQDPGSVAAATSASNHWDATLDARVGFPVGHLRVGEFPGSSGTNLRLHDLGIDVSEAVQATMAFHLTRDDAVRAGFLYYFLDGRTTLHHSVFFNGPEFTPGSLTTNADFYRLSLDYERTLLHRPSGEQLVVTAGLTYVSFNPTLTGANRSSGSPEGNGRSNSEDFYRQELPVPILGIRWDHPLGQRLLMRLSASGGGLPRVDSLRKEGGTVYLSQSHADVGAGLVYIVNPHVELHGGYHFTYFFQHEKSHEDDNLFELIDNGIQVGVTARF